MRVILYTVAYDDNQALVLAVDALKGHNYHCPECKGDMIPRRSIEQKKGAKRPHYAHKVKSPNCKPESVLHFGFKRMLSQRIQKHLDNKEPLPIKWHCSVCEGDHEGNLLKKAIRVAEEYSLGPCRPDIVLTTEMDSPVWALEVVVTHAPEDRTLDHYRANRIALARFDLKSDTDLVKATAPVLEPDHVDQCANPRCPKCQRFQRNVVLSVIQGDCWKCDSIMPIAIVEAGEARGNTWVGPEHFTDAELKLARSKGCLIKNKYSRTQRRSYPANTCKSCGAFAGEFHMHTEYVAPAEYGELEQEKFNAGYYCTHCEPETILNTEWSDVDDVSDEQKDAPHARAYKEAEPTIPEWQKAKEGFCIRCRTPIVRNKYKPLCSTCFPHEGTREREGLPIPLDYTFCLRCGERNEATRWKPFCLPCFHIAGGRR
jgi:hypothetical protein